MRMHHVIVGILSLCLSAGSLAGQPKQPAKSPLMADGFLQQVRGPLERILQFRLEGDNLKIDRKSWEAAAKDAPPDRFGQLTPLAVLFRQIRHAAGAYSSSESAARGGEHQITFIGNNLSGQLHTRGQVVHLRLEEAQGPQRSLEFRDDGQGGLRVLLIHADGDLILLNQARKGGFTATVVTAGQVFVKQEASFLAFLRKHHRDLDAHFLPVLDALGIQPILSPNAPRVRKAVLAQITRTPEMLAEGKALFADLESDKFKVRDRASKLLNERFDIYKDLIQEKLKDKSLALEPQRRLSKIVDDHADWHRIDEVIAALDLGRNAGYLISLFDHIPPERLARLVDRLQTVTGQALGSDPAAWREWAKKMLK